jgi:hypothetical protein
MTVEHTDNKRASSLWQEIESRVSHYEKETLYSILEDGRPPITVEEKEELSKARATRERQSQAGKKRGEKNQSRDQRIVEAAGKLAAEGREEKEIRMTLAERFEKKDGSPLTPTRIGQILRPSRARPKIK